MAEREGRRTGIACALLAAGLFGASTPLAKLLSPRVSPLLLAGLLYLGSGVGLCVVKALRDHFGTDRAREAPLQRGDWRWLAAAIGAGGIVGPALLMWGLAMTPASTASLLLNFEGVATALLAWFVFRENFDARIAIGMGCITGGGVALSSTGSEGSGGVLGMVAIVGACVAWGIDNNLTRKVAASDPVRIGVLKGLVAGTVNTGLGLALGATFPAPLDLASVCAIGFLGYGASLTLYIRGLRHLGAARCGAYFSTAPFAGAAFSMLLLREQLTAAFVVATVLMAIGVVLHLSERHEHLHRHEAMAHAHRHVHDEHHRHEHGPDDPPGEPHSHWHRHEPIEHSHPHYPDLHHRHRH
jgi:drug/metabolite transporter (DMT)-like permease